LHTSIHVFFVPFWWRSVFIQTLNPIRLPDYAIFHVRVATLTVFNGRISVEQQSIMRTVSFRLMPPLPYSLCFFVHAFIVGWNSNWLHILNWFLTLLSFSIEPETMTLSSSSRAIFLNLPFLELVLAWSVLLLAVECSCHVPVQSITWEAGRISDPNLNPNPNTYPSLWYYDILHLIMLSVC